MQQFKVGDWVRHPSYGIGKILAYNTSGAYDTVEVKGDRTWGTRSTLDGTFDRDIRLDHLEPWQPKEGEWCWFGHRVGKVINVFTMQGKIKVESTVGYNCYIMRGRRKEFDEIRYDWDVDNCEPFIGQLPSFIKE